MSLSPLSSSSGSRKQSLVVEDLEKWGPGGGESASIEQARALCERLVRRQYENFSVLSSVVPRDLRDDFAAVYAYCRWADDLGDEFGNRAKALELLGWWRSELDACYAGDPRHPVFVALRPIIERHDLPRQPFDHLIDAFEQDQRVDSYETWDELIAYCRLSANPVGRLVLMLFGEERKTDSKTVKRSDELCTALQLTNHWQDVHRDLVDRGRIYIPRKLMTGSAGGPDQFEERLRGTVAQGYAVDPSFLEESRCRRLLRIRRVHRVRGWGREPKQLPYFPRGQDSRLGHRGRTPPPPPPDHSTRSSPCRTRSRSRKG